jgi:hypothetical protein
MPLLFAHHDMFDALDVLHLNPVTPLDHALALATYAALGLVLVLGLRWAGRAVLRRVPPARAISGLGSSIESRSLEG